MEWERSRGHSTAIIGAMCNHAATHTHARARMDARCMQQQVRTLQLTHGPELSLHPGLLHQDLPVVDVAGVVCLHELLGGERPVLVFFAILTEGKEGTKEGRRLMGYSREGVAGCCM